MVDAALGGCSCKGTFAIIGLSRFGESLALALLEHGCDVLGIESNSLLVQRLSPKLPCVVLDATDEAALREVDISTFDAVVVAIGSDFESNLLTTVALKSLGVRHVVSLTTKEYQREILLRVGADQVVEPEAEAGRRLARELTTPDEREQMALGPSHYVATVAVPPSLAGQSLSELSRQEGLQVTVLAIQRGDVSLPSPAADTVVLGGDLLVILRRGNAN